MSDMSQLEPPAPPTPSVPDTSKKKPFYKKKWFIILAVLSVIGAFASNSNSSKTTPKKSVSTTDATSSTDSVAPSTSAEPTETVSESNARKKAESYLEFMAFSRSGLITQLEFEGFTPAQAAYGVSTTGL